MSASALDNIKEKIAKRDEDFRIYTYDNGYLIEVGGRDDEGEWVTAKVFAVGVQEVLDTVAGILEIPLTS